MVVEDGKTAKLKPRKKVHNIGQACQALAACTRDNIMEKTCSDDEDSEDEKFQDDKEKDILKVEDQRVGYKRSVKKKPVNDDDVRFSAERIPFVLALKAASFCASVALEKDAGSKAKGSVNLKTPKLRNEKKGVLGGSKSTGKVAYTGTHEMVVKKVVDDDDDDNDFVLDTDEQEHRRLVLGLKAPKAPSLSAPQIRASMKAKTPVKRKREIQKKVVREKLKNKIDAYTGTLDMVVRDEEDFILGTEGQEEFINLDRNHEFDVTLPPLGPRSSNDARNKVREVLRLFQLICRKILQGEEAKNNDLTSEAPIKRVDLAARAVIEKKGRALDLGVKTYGPVPGVEVGDEFQYRVELTLVGIHRVFQAGIDYVKQGKHIVAVSIVASGGYDNEVDKPDCLVYSGAGGVTKDKTFFDQTLERGNLALKNSMDLKIPVRVIRGYKASSDLKSKIMTTYIYDGLYTVDRYWQEPGPNGNLVYKFELKRNAGQPELALREVKSKKFKTREGVVEIDIANGKEPFRISAINTIDNEKPPVFTYVTNIMYPDWYRPVLTKGCDCVGRCSTKKCSCGVKNGGEIPYNHNGAIVEAKPLVYECGPHCKCPPNCYNRVTQHGMKIQLEIFKTESRGWGVRSLSSISSGTFICEYIGELLEDTEAEKRTGNDEYLFDIGQNYSNCPVTTDTKSEEIVDSEGFTIDAANYGNVGRFINHSCSPNLYAQNVLFDQEDKRMPHIMLFAAENIPPLQELTYHYNYEVDTVHDSDGNIKVKNCYCGSAECTGRLY
ncbi:histone-lysine N-methyltransferase, H3 lysine-9 specific SUVH6-like [Rutidosis leptorrhynchoides]|uniref:histone-lysine N-methyltransferase, H3 lysine-9 specific SUVH6-like n=1 Tax=Rutidosis leptorrhynchoides TaxID=125765 RepID=UPI003A9A4D19